MVAAGAEAIPEITDIVLRTPRGGDELRPDTHSLLSCGAEVRGDTSPEASASGQKARLATDEGAAKGKEPEAHGKCADAPAAEAMGSTSLGTCEGLACGAAQLTLGVSNANDACGVSNGIIACVACAHSALEMRPSLLTSIALNAASI